MRKIINRKRTSRRGVSRRKRTSRKRVSRKRTSRKRVSRKKTSKKRTSRMRVNRKRTSTKRASRKRVYKYRANRNAAASPYPSTIITVKGFFTNYEIYINLDETVKDLKIEIQGKSNGKIPWILQKLKYDGAVLKNNEKLQTYGIEDEDNVNLLFLDEKGILICFFRKMLEAFPADALEQRQGAEKPALTWLVEWCHRNHRFFCAQQMPQVRACENCRILWKRNVQVIEEIIAGLEDPDERSLPEGLKEPPGPDTGDLINIITRFDTHTDAQRAAHHGSGGARSIRDLLYQLVAHTCSFCVVSRATTTTEVISLREFMTNISPTDEYKEFIEELYNGEIENYCKEYM